MHLETLQCCAHCSLCSLHFREAGFSVIPLYNHKRHFKTTFSPKLTGKEITSSPASDASGFQPVPHTGFVYLYRDSRFLSETGLEISASCPRWAWLFLLPVQDRPCSIPSGQGSVKQAKEVCKLPPIACTKPTTLFLGKC